MKEAIKITLLTVFFIGISMVLLPFIYIWIGGGYFQGGILIVILILLIIVLGNIYDVKERLKKNEAEKKN
ncbi:hypothetical protein [Alkalihalobacillus pseudalcaliphilus]|uniref:hypothetical protein n=1 Tax=Alkalihalobacillus pseudalcaliphilus TaxID=79884 RepID=UPI00064E02E3|nr:hypothetical protein [Alkalihalobacillus pseudalcaliphilus]KMK78047.1 hypothetical protein AB990_00920 [Alkalihalobacillus pseudalcaliphilus]